MALPTTMKVVHQPDPLTDDLVMDESPLPATTDTHPYLVRVYATSPCVGELTWERYFPQLFDGDRERVPGTECSGVIVSGPASGAFRAGDEVFFRAQPPSTGCAREYTVAMEGWLARKPVSLGWVDAAATPLSSLTAHQGLFARGGLDRAALRGDAAAREANARKRVLITGAGGGVGTWAVQLAAAAGAGAVVGVCGTSNVDAVRALGATEVIDYRKQSIDEWAAEDPSGRECDIVLDCVGGSTLGGCWASAREGGTLLSIVTGPDSLRPEGSAKKLAKSEWFLVEPLGSDLAEIAKLADEGKCVPQVDSVYAFEDFDKAFTKVAERHSKGKVIIKVVA